MHDGMSVGRWLSLIKCVLVCFGRSRLCVFILVGDSVHTALASIRSLDFNRHMHDSYSAACACSVREGHGEGVIKRRDYSLLVG